MNQLYPKELEDNLRWRALVIDDCEKDSKTAENFVKMCAKDILFFFNAALWTYDPRSELKDLPFITYPFQDDYINWLVERIDKQDDGLTDKSRDMGVSWMVLGVLVHKWLFDAGFSALIGSYIETLVDDKDNMDTHFGRLRYIISRLPAFMQPKLNDPYMKLVNLENNNTIIGYAPTEKFSRQGRYTVIWPDEFAFWQHGRSAWTSMGDASRCRIPTSTVNGKGNKFAELSLKSRINKQTLHWRLHPLKDDKWYAKECERRTPEEVAQELDINYNKSVLDRVYPEFCDRNYMEIEEYNPLQPLYVAWDFGLNDPTALIWLQEDLKTGQVRIVDSYQSNNKSIDFFVPFITGTTTSGLPYSYNNIELEIIERHKSWQPAIHYGDPTGNNKTQAGMTSVIATLKKYGIVINYSYKKFDLTTRIRETKLLIRKLLVDKGQDEFIDAMENCRYPQRSEASQSTSANNTPIHDYTSHFRTALEFFAVNYKSKVKAEKTIYVNKPDTSFEERLADFNHRVRKDRQNKPTYRRAC